MGVPFQPWIFWLIIFIIMVVIEMLTLGLTSIWFAGGALVALFVSLPHTGAHVQIILFVAVSAFFLILVRPWVLKHFNHGLVRTNAQSLIGQTAVVLEAIDNVNEKGRVQIRGQEWTARSTREKEYIPKDTPVRVMDISGVKLIVERSEDASARTCAAQSAGGGEENGHGPGDDFPENSGAFRNRKRGRRVCHL